MPELPEVEAWCRLLDPDVKRSPIEKAGPAHIATLKTYDPPLAALEDTLFAGARRRAKRLLFPTDDGELVLMVHLMSAGRIRYVAPGEEPEDSRVPAPVRGRRRARPHRGRTQEARRRLVDAAGRRRGRARRSRAGGGHADGGDAGAHSRGGRTPAPLATPRPEADRGDRTHVGERDPQHGAALAVRPVDAARRGGDKTPRRCDPQRARPRTRSASRTGTSSPTSSPSPRESTPATFRSAR